MASPVVHRLHRAIDAALGPSGGLSPAFERRLLVLVAFGYATWVVVGLAYHEPWSDEAQAWMIARDASLPEILGDRLRHEGSPGLWHLLLHLPARIGMPFVTMQVIAGCLAVTGVLLLLFVSPFPLLLKVVLPFSYFPGYQYAIIARSYCLFLPLIGAIGWVWPRRAERPGLFALLVVLLSQVSVHGILLAGAVMAVHACDSLDKASVVSIRTVGTRRAAILPILVFIAAMALTLIVLWVPADAEFAQGGKIHWELWTDVPGAIEQACRASLGMTDPWVPVSVMMLVLVGLLGEIPALGLVFSVAALAAFFTLVYVNVSNHGAIVMAILLWSSVAYSAPAPRLRRHATTLLLLCLFASQFPPTLKTWLHDLDYPFSGGQDAAAFLRDNGLQTRRVWGIRYWVVALQPYFDSNILNNHGTKGGPGYYAWTINADHDPPGVEPPPPGEYEGRILPWYDVLILDQRLLDSPETLAGFRLVHTSPGDMMFFGRAWESETFYIFTKAAVETVPTR